MNTEPVVRRQFILELRNAMEESCETVSDLYMEVFKTQYENILSKLQSIEQRQEQLERLIQMPMRAAKVKAKKSRLQLPANSQTKVEFFLTQARKRCYDLHTGNRTSFKTSDIVQYLSDLTNTNHLTIRNLWYTQIRDVLIMEQRIMLLNPDSHPAARRYTTMPNALILP